VNDDIKMTESVYIALQKVAEALLLEPSTTVVALILAVGRGEL
jgi:hypothetical protein